MTYQIQTQQAYRLPSQNFIRMVLIALFTLVSSASGALAIEPVSGIKAYLAA